ncbi:hypothetical protein RBSH_03683 [Rhodopirellula baltica SH28]|uniref:Uncharacterized protein n=1 Tax=Rhodopirellula baltica SH28 TaxID=993517 RepID=K5CC16_RHOBT|nr:hypothetical protein RBSH_03683 [Rhodopirellula baltica SH28]
MATAFSTELIHRDRNKLRMSSPSKTILVTSIETIGSQPTIRNEAKCRIETPENEDQSPQRWRGAST